MLSLKTARFLAHDSQCLFCSNLFPSVVAELENVSLTSLMQFSVSHQFTTTATAHTHYTLNNEHTPTPSAAKRYASDRDGLAQLTNQTSLSHPGLSAVYPDEDDISDSLREVLAPSCITAKAALCADDYPLSLI